MLVQRDDLTVEQHVGLELACKDGERARDLGELAGLVVAEPRPEPHGTRAATGPHHGERSNAVVLRLVGEPRVGQRGLVQRGQHRAGERLWHRRCRQCKHARRVRPGDIIVTFQGEPIQSPHDLTRRVAGTPPGSKVTLRVARSGGQTSVDTTLGRLKDAPPSPAGAER
ncbi:MAG: hypothetical protein DMD76_04455 [Candidatus Rokuibacteriota bacterium]|nr:MAG: hypothetical protein DMD76_04455 [Candidatus Rokubacteria bacterium]